MIYIAGTVFVDTFVLKNIKANETNALNSVRRILEAV